MAYYTLLDAWEAYENGKLELAAQIWEALIATAPDADTRRNHELGYSYVLIAQKEFEQARSMLQQNHRETLSTVYLHQLGIVEREAGRYEEALQCFTQEREVLTPENYFALAANAHELGMLSFKLNQTEAAQHHAESCLADARRAQDTLTEGCALRLLGDMAAAGGELEQAREQYAAAQVCFTQLEDNTAVQEIQIRLAALD